VPRPAPEADLAIMRRLDRLHLESPFAGSRTLQGLLTAEGCKIGRRHVKTPMRRMGIEALYRRPRTTKPEPGHKIYPYLLRNVEIAPPNQVRAMDITYIPLARGFDYLAVVLDWFSRRVLSWRLSITMEAAFCVETPEDALGRHGRPDIFNTDQGSQFTGSAFISVLTNNDLRSAWTAKLRTHRTPRCATRRRPRPCHLPESRASNSLMPRRASASSREPPPRSIGEAFASNHIEKMIGISPLLSNSHRQPHKPADTNREQNQRQYAPS
jgi:transposase InsO family protein